MASNTLLKIAFYSDTLFLLILLDLIVFLTALTLRPPGSRYFYYDCLLAIPEVFCPPQGNDLVTGEIVFLSCSRDQSYSCGGVALLHFSFLDIFRKELAPSYCSNTYKQENP